MARPRFVDRFLERFAVAAFLALLTACGGGGDGSASTWFGEPIVTTLDSAPRNLAFGDFDGDGKPDAVFSLADGIVHVMLGQGDGTFHPPQATAAVKGLSGIAIGDVDGDRVSDLALTRHCVGSSCEADVSSLHVMLGNGDGTFGAPHVYEILEPSSSALSVVIGDLNGDGFGDIAVGTYNTTILVFLAEGDGSLRPPTKLRTLPVTMDVLVAAVAVADVDGDRRADLIAFDVDQFSYAGVSTFLGFGDGTFGTARFQGADVTPLHTAVVDFNRDGRADVAFNGNRTGMRPGAGRIKVLLGNGDGTFVSTEPSYPWSYWGATFAAGDVDRDGFPDLVVRPSSSGELSILLARGGEAIAEPLKLDDAHVHALIDLDGDGRLDLVLVTTNGFAVLRAAR